MANKEISLFNQLLEYVDRGRIGQNRWIPVPYPRLGQHLGIAKRIYTLIGGAPGTGKSAFCHYTYILSAYNWWYKNQDNTDIKLKVIYRSMERSKIFTIGKWTCLWLYSKYGIVLDVKDLFTWASQRSKVTDQVYEKVVEARDYFERMQDVVHIIDGAENPTGVRNQLSDWANQNGKLVDISQWERKYVPNNENLITVFVIDHIGRMKLERGFTKKQNIDKMSEYASIARDLFGFTPVIVAQLNRNITDVSRRINTDLSPEESDFADSSNMFQDSDVVLALFDPKRYGLRKYKDYDIYRTITKEGESRFRSVSMLKNSYGVDGVILGFQFVGEVGKFSELPHPRDITDPDQFYTNLITI